MRHSARVDIVRTWQRARQQFAALMTELADVKREREELRKELADTRARLHELSAAVLERTKAFHELRHLQRERDIHRARMAERVPARPVH